MVLPKFRAQNPHLEVETVVKRNQHPYVEGTFGARPAALQGALLQPEQRMVGWMTTAGMPAAPPIGKPAPATSPLRPPAQHPPSTRPAPAPPPPAPHRTAGNNASRPIGVKNLATSEIAEHVSWLRTTHGRTGQRRITSKHIVSKRPSIQGPWSPGTASLMQHVRFEAQEAAATAAVGQQQ
jgi:hypothetical protein